MAYEIVISKRARRQLTDLSREQRKDIGKRISTLAENPRGFGCIKLKGLTDQYRIRVGNYRVVYQIFDQKLIVLVIAVAHRKNIYKGD